MAPLPLLFERCQMPRRPAAGSMLGPQKLVTKIPTQEDQTVPGGNFISCFMCSVPKDPAEFQGDSVICRPCDKARKEMMEISIAEQEDDVFNAALKKLRKTAVPALPAGVQAAKAIVGGTSTEILGKTLRKILHLDDPNGDQKEVNMKLLMNALSLYQKAEMMHDQQLTEQNAYKGIDPEDLTAVLQKHVVQKMTEDASFKRWLITEMIESVDGFLHEVVAIAKSRTVHSEIVLNE